MIVEKDRKEHESYGIASVVRRTGRMNLFGSEITHGNVVTIAIHEAYQYKNDFGLIKERTKSRAPIIEFSMSHNQFAELITSAGMGEGTPITINRRDGKIISEPEKPKETFDGENNLDSAISSTLNANNDLMKALNQALAT
jgi:hypothetical protein